LARRAVLQARHLSACAGRFDRIADLRTGKADIARGLNADDTTVLKGDAQLQILSVPTERIGYLFVNALWGPTKDVRVRRAIAHAIDRG